MDSENISSIRRTMKYWCMYLTILIIDTIRFACGVMVLLYLLFALQSVLDLLKDNLNVQIDLSSGAKWAIRFFIMVLIAIMCLILYCGWRGYNRLTFTPTMIYSCLHALEVIGSIYQMTVKFTFGAIILFLVLMVLTVYSFLFTFEIRNIRKQNYNVWFWISHAIKYNYGRTNCTIYFIIPRILGCFFSWRWVWILSDEYRSPSEILSME